MRRKKRRKLRRKGMKYLGSSENSSRRTRPPHHVGQLVDELLTRGLDQHFLLQLQVFPEEGDDDEDDDEEERNYKDYLGNGETASCWSAIFGLGRNKDSRLPWRRTVNLKQSNFSSRDHSTFNFNLAFGFHFPNIRFSHEGIWKESP